MIVATLASSLVDSVPARDRTVPVDEPFASMLPDGGLQRGRAVGCAGPAAMTAAAVLVAGAVRAGSWVLLLGAGRGGLPVGLEAFAELGVPLHRVVAVDGGDDVASWAERVVTAADGFELILCAPPRGAERVERKVRQRLQARGAVLVPVGMAGHAIGCDVTITTTSPRWAGIGQGHGRLTAREIDVVVAGRRVPRPVRRTFWLPGPDGRIRAADTVSDHASDAAATSVSELPVG